MKKLLTLAVGFFLAVASGQTGPSGSTSTVQLAWNASASASAANPLTYTVWLGTNSGVYTGLVSAGSNLTTTISTLTRGVTYYFSVTAATSNGVTSAYSAEVNYQAAPAPIAPAGLTVKAISP